MPGIGSVKMNPFGGASALFLIVSPFLTWITIVSVVTYQGVIVFGTATQSNLLMVTSSQLGTNISDTASSSAAFSIVLLLIAGIVMLKSSRFGVPIGVLGLAAYVIPFYRVFGSQTSGLQQTFISPGIGFFVAGTGVVLGSISLATKARSPASLVAALGTRMGLTKLGVSSSVVGLSLDVANHTALGQLPAFIGFGLLQYILHLGLVAAVASTMALTIIGGKYSNRTNLSFLSAATLLLLGLDAAYSISTGDLNDFLGHNLTETVLHLAVYYGFALTLIANFFRPE